MSILYMDVKLMSIKQIGRILQTRYLTDISLGARTAMRALLSYNAFHECPRFSTVIGK